MLAPHSEAARRFQCSSASRKFLNPSETQQFNVLLNVFQCSSASRKFLNHRGNAPVSVSRHRFSALQRAENSSIPSAGLLHHPRPSRVSVLFSEPKIPQFIASHQYRVRRVNVSVLFSEPKIPQFRRRRNVGVCGVRFSALQRAENSSICVYCPWPPLSHAFQCSSASRKFLNGVGIEGKQQRTEGVSVLFSEPKIPQLCSRPNRRAVETRFQCSSASRKFLNAYHQRDAALIHPVSVLFSEPKIPQLNSACWLPVDL